MQSFYDPSTTASTAAVSSSSTSTTNDGSSRRNSYEVFLSFRGEDTRHNFVSHLYKEFKQKGIHTFMDDRKLEMGDSLTPSLLEAISFSRVAVVVLSEHFASSTWCLTELVQIIECRKRNGQLVVPIFYKVDPSDVKNQRGNFGENLKMHEKKRKRDHNDYEAEMKKWKNALAQVATIAGWDSNNMRDEANLIECVVRDISDKLACATSSSACDDFVAIGSQIIEIDRLLKIERDIHMLGIWGMGGIGKTTLAKILYDRMFSQYEACCFLRNVKDKFKKVGADGLQKELLSKLLKERDLDIWFLDGDSSILKKRLCCKKVLIVLDDVDDIKQLQALAKNHNWFGLQSTILITTRDKRLLNEHGVDTMYKVKCLNNDEALLLFSRHAFKQNQIKKEYCKLAYDFVNYAQGLPLALKVLGCSLHDRSMDFWKDELHKLRSTLNSDISNVLKISFDGLEDNEKDVFLDIACFHNWTYKDEVRHILRSCYLFPDSAFPILIERSLIYIQKGGQVCVHQLLQDMGRDIIRRESDNPGKRSRLWDSKDIRYVLTKKKGTNKIKSVSLNLSEIQGKMILEEDAFMGMDRLRFLKVYASSIWDRRKLHLPSKLQLPHCGLQFYTDELAYLCWSMEFSALRFFAQNLVELDMSYSKVETLWEGPQEFVNLKILNLCGSNSLVRIPNLSKAPNIVTINLARCESLVEVHSSIQYLNKLENLDLWKCENLEILPSRLDSNVLTFFSIRGCRKVKKCPEFAPCLCLHTGACENHSHLHGNPMLDLSGTAITEFPRFTGFMSRMETLDLLCCKNFSQLPNWLDKFKSLKNIYLQHTSFTELPQSIENLTLLKELHFSYCNKLESLSANLHRLSSLSSIIIHKCKRLRSVPKLPPLLSCLEAPYCESLENFLDNSKDDTGQKKYCWFIFEKCFKLSEKARNNIFSFAESTFQKCKPSQVVRFILSGSEIPPWICEQAVGSSINVQTPSNFAAVICCLVFNGGGLSLRESPELRCECQFKGDNGNQDHIEDILKGRVFFRYFSSSSSVDEMVLFNLEKPEALDCVVVNELSFKLWARFWRREDCFWKKGKIEMKVKKCGICFVNEGGIRLRAPAPSS